MHQTHRTGSAAVTTFTTIGLTSAAAFAQGGDDAANAVPIAIPSTVTGTTIGFTDTSDEVCPYEGSTSPDVYYRYDAPADADLELVLCQSGYDTKLYVYDANLELVVDAFANPACNDDSCSSAGGKAFRSRLDCIPVTAGETYFVVIDGWAGDAGPYELVARLDPDSCQQFEDCIVTCPPGATIEGEPCEFGNTDPDDLFNGGCNCSDPAGCFLPLVCGEIFCGRSYFDGAFRDTDWWLVDLTPYPDGVTLTVSALAEFPAVVIRTFTAESPTQNPCPGTQPIEELVVGEACARLQFTTDALTGAFTPILLAPDFSEIVDCNDPDPPFFEIGADYLITLECVVPPPPCPWDLDDDGAVGFADLLQVLSNWGDCP